MPENTEAKTATPQNYGLLVFTALTFGAMVFALLYYFAQGSLLVVTDAPATLMLLKGERTITATDDGRLESPLLTYGTYTLRVDAPGYEPVQQNLVPPFGRSVREVRIALTPLPEAPPPVAEVEKKPTPASAPTNPPQPSRDIPPQEPAADETDVPLEESLPGYQDPFTGMEFVTIPKGCFRMGSPGSEKGREDDEAPLHQVCVESFLMGKYEVTQGQWEKVTGNRPAQFRKGEQYPVEQVSWLDAQDFIQKLNQRTGKLFRLPSEAEWEYAVRAGAQTSRYWGDDQDKACQHENVADLSEKKPDPLSPVHNCDDGFSTTAPVGSFLPNAFGLHDMLGNVSEWCEDWYDPEFYKQSPRDNPRCGNSSGVGRRVVRGGSWLSVPAFVRSANRYMNVPAIRYGDIGLRLVLPATNP